MVSPERFFTALESDTLPSVIGCGGKERVLLDDALDIVRTRALEGGLADFNHDRVSAREDTANDIVNLANMLPTMAKRRLVEVHDCEQLELNDALRSFIENPAKESVVLFVFGSKCDVRKKLPKTLDKHALFAKFDHPKEHEMVRWVERRAKKRSLRLSPDAAEAVAFTVGNDLGLVDRALDKLELLVSEGEITLDIVSEHIADTSVQDAFAFGRSVALAERKPSLIALSNLESDRAQPLQLLGLLAWQLRQVTRARALLDDGRSQGDIRKELRLFGDRASSVMNSARKFTLFQHQRRLARVAESDRKLKSSGALPWLIMTDLVLTLCPPARPRR